LTTTVPIPVFSDISVQPGFELFEYENKIGHTHLQTFSPVMKITFSFDRYSGGKWGKVLRYNPETAADSGK
jgi:hypothetical protein